MGCNAIYLGKIPVRLLNLRMEDKVHNNIFFTNSIHVTDLAFFFAGMSEEISAYTAEQNDWTETWWKLRTHLTDGISLDYLRWWMPF